MQPDLQKALSQAQLVLGGLALVMASQMSPVLAEAPVAPSAPDNTAHAGLVEDCRFPFVPTPISPDKVKLIPESAQMAEDLIQKAVNLSHVKEQKNPKIIGELDEYNHKELFEIVRLVHERMVEKAAALGIENVPPPPSRIMLTDNNNTAAVISRFDPEKKLGAAVLLVSQEFLDSTTAQQKIGIITHEWGHTDANFNSEMMNRVTVPDVDQVIKSLENKALKIAQSLEMDFTEADFREVVV